MSASLRNLQTREVIQSTPAALRATRGRESSPEQQEATLQPMPGKPEPPANPRAQGTRHALALGRAHGLPTPHGWRCRSDDAGCEPRWPTPPRRPSSAADPLPKHQHGCPLLAQVPGRRWYATERGRSGTSSKHGLPPPRRHMLGRNRKSTQPVSQANTKVSKAIHLGAGAAILAGVGF